jgi:hypothetical protein
MVRARVAALLLIAALPAWAQTCFNAQDSTDSDYGGRIRRLVKAEGHEHNLYYDRDPWNADQSYMLGIQSGLDQKNWTVVLYDGQGCFLKSLFPITKYDWRVVWDRHDPLILYTWRGSLLYRYHVDSAKADLLKDFKPLTLASAGPSINQAGDRLLVITSDHNFRSYRLSTMQDERAFTAEYPPGCASGFNKERYISFRNYVMTSCQSRDGAAEATLIYDDTGRLYHRFDGVGGGGHHDFSPDGRWAYFKLWSRTSPLEIHVVNLDGSNDRVLVSIPGAQLRYVQNLHLAWPRGVNDWFVASFFPNAGRLPAGYAPYLDEIVQIRVDGTHRTLARSRTAYLAAKRQSGGAQDFFWAQPLARPSADGSRINFNSNAAGTIDQCLLWVDAQHQAAEGSPADR